MNHNNLVVREGNGPMERMGEDVEKIMAERGPVVGIAGEWFTAHGRGVNLGYYGKEGNRRIAERLRRAFSEWIDNGHNDFDDENTIILCVELTDGVLLSHGTRYEFQLSA